MQTNSIAERIATVQAQIAAAAQRANRPLEEITLVAVTKTQPPEAVAAALAAGVRTMGENRVQEASEKIAALASQRAHLRWHLIGHLQRNKARPASELFDLVHSLDSLRLAEALNRVATEDGGHETKRLPVLLQVNVSGETSKEGFDLQGGLENGDRLAAFLADVEHILTLPHLQLQGLMTIAPWGPDPEAARPVFRRLRTLRDALAQRYPAADWRHLSMGMSDDFAIAIEEGATLVRVGRAIFGERATSAERLPVNG